MSWKKDLDMKNKIHIKTPHDEVCYFEKKQQNILCHNFEFGTFNKMNHNCTIIGKQIKYNFL